MECCHLGVDVLELSIAVGATGSFARLAVGLQAEAKAAQQPANQFLSCRKTLLGQRCRQMALALADPQQGSLGIATDRGLHQIVQCRQKSRLRLNRRLAATTYPTNPGAELLRSHQQVRQAATDGAAGDPRCF